jgi:hypothetical protein
VALLLALLVLVVLFEAFVFGGSFDGGGFLLGLLFLLLDVLEQLQRLAVVAVTHSDI